MQAQEARESGTQEVLKLLQQPEDLNRLQELRVEYDNKARIASGALSSIVQSQVEATRNGLELLERSQRHVMKLKELCVEYDNKARIASGALSSIVQSQVEATRNGLELLERSQRHVMKLKGAIESIHDECAWVLSEIEDIIDLPQRAEMVLALLKDSANMLPAFEALTSAHAASIGLTTASIVSLVLADSVMDEELSGLMPYCPAWLSIPSWPGCTRTHFWDYDHQLAWGSNQTLVLSAGSLEMKGHFVQTTIPMPQAVDASLLGGPPRRAEEQEVLLYLMVPKIKPTLLVDCLRVIELQEQLDDMYKRTKMESTPKGFRKLLFRKIERHIAEKFQPVIEMGEATGKFNTKMKYDTNGDLVLDEVRDYLGNLVSVTRISPSTGVEEVVEDPQELQGIEIIEEESDLAIAYDFVSSCFPPSYAIFDRLVALYHGHLSLIIDSVGQKAKALSTKGSLRVMEFVRKYMCEPRPGPRGLLRTPGVTDFFRIMNEEIAVIMSIDDHGEVMFQTALCAVRIMQGFQIAEEAVISESSQMSFEMLCAQLNNNVECHDQSVEFAEEVQKQLSPEFRKQLDIDDVCRGFLEVAKIAAKRSAERFVEPSFNKRVAESALDVLVRRSINMFVISNPPITEAVVERMTADIDAAVQYFGEHMRPDRIQVAIKPLLDLRVAEITAAFDRLVVEYTNFTVDFMQHCLANRTLALLKKSEKDILAHVKTLALLKKSEKDILAHVKVVWKKLAEEKEGRAQAKGGAWFSWG
eukprot:gene31949-33734_t